MPSQAIRNDPELISIEALDSEIVALSHRMTTQEYEFLMLLCAFDERGGWLKWGSASCAEWLHWRCDLSLSAAREKVRVARALKTLAFISQAFEAGLLSYSKVRALTRVANPGNEAELLSYASNVSAALVEQYCQQLRNVNRDATRSAKLAYERRALSAFRNHVANTMTVTLEVPIEEGELVLNALDKALAEESDRPDISTVYRVRQADALVDLCRKSLRGGIGRSPTRTVAAAHG